MRRAPCTLALTALTTLTVLMLGAPAHAAGCPLITDPAGDHAYFGLPVAPAPVDILSVDVASGPTTVVATVRVATGMSTVDLLLDDLGMEWMVAWEIAGTEYTASARTPFLAPFAYTWSFSAGTGPVALTVDRAAGSITWTIPRSYLLELATPGQTFTRIRGSSRFLSSTADVAYDWSATYVDQTAGCIPAA